ncbi:MAG TPA: K(+)-transporting ATPase subunit F [Rectinemataceae bacterium]|nr:K(+)-transporting ATPase subunit F [Rectinemataceae bacterium]
MNSLFLSLGLVLSLLLLGYLIYVMIRPERF